MGSYDDPNCAARVRAHPRKPPGRFWACWPPAIPAANAWRAASITCSNTQKPDGGWDDDWYTGTGFPRVFYLKYHMYAEYFPLLALATYLKAKGNAG